LGEVAAIEASEAERAVGQQITGIRSAFEQWQAQKAIADSLKSYDPTPELAKLDDEIRQREAEAARAADDKQKQVALVAQTRAKATEARAQVENFRNQEASIRASVANATQTQRAAAFEQALTIKRQGDEYEQQAAGFEAVAASQAPEVETLQNTIDKLNRQVQLLRDAKKSIVARADANKSQAAAATTEADQVAAKVTDLLKSLDEARAKVVGPTDEAAKLYALAVNAAKKSGMPGGAGGAGGKSSANMIAGNAQQSHGDVLAAKARGLGAYASLIQTLNTGGQPGVTAEMLTQAKQAHADAVKAAEESYRSAIAMFESAGGNAEAKEKVAKLTAAVTKLTGAPEAPPAEVPAAAPTDDKPVEKPAAGASAAPAAGSFDAAAVEADVKAALVAIKADASANPDPSQSLTKWMKAEDPVTKEFVDLVMGLTGKKVAMDAACKAKFGKDLTGLIAETKQASVKGNPMLGMMGQMAGQISDQFGGLDAEKAQISAVSATEASVSMEGSPQALKMVKTDTGWKLDMDSAMGGPQAKQMLAMSKGPIGAMSGAFEKITGQINAGEYATADDMLLKLNAELMAAMQKMMPGGGKPPTPPPPAGGG
jgi:hypothetical protein